MVIGMGEVVGLGLYSTGAAGSNTGTPEAASTPGAGLDPTKCDPNVLYPRGTPCDLIQQGVEMGIVIANRDDEEELKYTEQRPAVMPRQWIRGIDNVYVVAAGAVLALMMARRG